MNRSLLIDPVSEGLNCQAYEQDPHRLLKDVCSDHPKAMSCLFRQLRRYIMKTMKRQFFGWRKQEELLQKAFVDAFVILVENIQCGKFQIEGASFQTYFFSVFDRTLKKHRSKEYTYADRVLRFFSANPTEREENQEIEYEIERMDLVEDALSRLGRDCKDVVEMRAEGFSYQEISSKHPAGKQADTWKMKYSRCLKKLKQAILS